MPFSATLCHPSTHVRDPLDLGQAGRGGLMGLILFVFRLFRDQAKLVKRQYAVTSSSIATSYLQQNFNV